MASAFDEAESGVKSSDEIDCLMNDPQVFELGAKRGSLVDASPHLVAYFSFKFKRMCVLARSLVCNSPEL